MFNKILFSSLHSISQVFFIENKYTALFFLSAFAYSSYLTQNPYFFIAAVVGALLSTLFAMALKYDEEDIKSGLYGFNGVLTALAIILFVWHSAYAWLLVVIGVFFSVVLTNTFTNILTRKFAIPASTGPFVFGTWLLLLASYQFDSLPVSDSLVPHFALQLTPVSQIEMNNFSILLLIDIFFKNIGQVYFLSEPVAGALLFFGILVGNRTYALFAAIGSVVAILVSFTLEANNHFINEGLYGFSAVLTSIAIGAVFLQQHPLYAVFAAVITVILQAALFSATSSFGIPTFTGAYVLCMYLFMAAINNQGDKSSGNN